MTVPPLARVALCGATLAVALAFAHAERVAAIPIASTNLSVVSSVNIACTIATVPATFGSYFVGGIHATTPLDGAGAVSVNCDVNGGNVRVRLGQGSYPAPGSTNANPLRQMAYGANRLAYNLYTDAARTTVWDNNAGAKTGKNFPVVMTVYGRIPAAQYVPSGPYADNVLATVSF